MLSYLLISESCLAKPSLPTLLLDTKIWLNLIHQQVTTPKAFSPDFMRFGQCTLIWAALMAHLPKVHAKMVPEGSKTKIT
jgi:hypothetical protein